MNDGNSQIPTGNSQVPKRSEATVLEYADFLGSNISAIYMCDADAFRCFGPQMFTDTNGYRCFGPQMFSDVNVCRCLRLTDAYDTYGQNIYMPCETLANLPQAEER